MHVHVLDPSGKDLLETTSDNRGSGRRTSRRRRAEPALVSGTSGEFLGRKPLPRSVTTPGTRELSASERVLTAAFGIAALSIVAVGAPFSRLRSLFPFAVTLTASRVVAAPDIAKSAVTVEPEVTTTERDCGP